MNGIMDVTPDDLMRCAESMRDINSRYVSLYNAMYDELDSNMGPAGSGKMWHGNRAQQALTDAQAKKDTFEAVSNLLEEKAKGLELHGNEWNNFDA